MIVIIAGVCGTGKTTVGEKVAEALSIPFYDADDFHPEANIQKMSGGTPLTDEDRWPWLDKLAQQLGESESQGGAVLACSALKESYRQRLMDGCASEIQWFMLNGTYELLEQRITARENHFMGSKMLESQLDTLELPNYGTVIDVEHPLEKVVQQVVRQVQQSG